MKSENFDFDLFSTFPPFITKANNILIALFISIFWLLSITLFNEAIKKNRKPKDKRREIMKSNYYGAQYTQLLEQKRIDYLKKKQLEESLYGFVKPKIDAYDENWINLFDDNNEDNK